MDHTCRHINKYANTTRKIFFLELYFDFTLKKLFYLKLAPPPSRTLDDWQKFKMMRKKASILFLRQLCFNENKWICIHMFTFVWDWWLFKDTSVLIWQQITICKHTRLVFLKSPIMHLQMTRLVWIHTHIFYKEYRYGKIRTHDFSLQSP